MCSCLVSRWRGFCPRARRPQNFILITEFSGNAKTMTPLCEPPLSGGAAGRRPQNYPLLQIWHCRLKAIAYTDMLAVVHYLILPSCSNLFTSLLSVLGSGYTSEEKLITNSLPFKLSKFSYGSSIYTQLQGTDDITGHLNPQKIGFFSIVTTNILP